MKKKTFIVSMIMVIVLFLLSVGEYLCYPIINKVIEEKSNRLYLEDYILDHAKIYDYDIALMIQRIENPDASFSQYLNFNTVDQDFIEEETNFVIDRFQNHLYQLKNQTDLYYYAVDTQTNQSISNTDDQLDELVDNQTLQNKYQCYYQIQYDSEGHFQINFSSYEDLNDFNQLIEDKYYYWEYNTEAIYNEETQEYIEAYTFENPKNLIITYAVPNQLSADSPINIYKMNPQSGLIIYALPYIFAFVFLTIIITLIVPYRYMEIIPFLSFISRIKFCILALLWTPLMLFLSYFAFPLIVGNETGWLTLLFQKLSIENAAPVLIPIINLLYWFIYFALFMIFVYLIKYIFKKGIKRYIIENTLIAWIIRKLYSLFYKIISFDFNDHINKVVLKIVLCNFIVISFIAIFHIFGILIAVIYSILLFIILKKQFNKILVDYEVLLHATRQLSSGDFNVKINEDVGLFNPLKNEFSHIKDGFEKAVQEEVKSQKMKTELISNVSHDLKTPLTSIITYIDLLKNNQLTEEQRQHYLEILDRNSLRLKNLIDDLFEVSKANSGNIQLNLIDVDIVSLIKQAQFEYQDKLDEENLDVRMNCQQEKIICVLDSAKTYRIFENLFINISKYALPHTRVYIDIVEHDDDVIITFKNISKDEMHFNENEIVERFVQGDKSRNTCGSGLGLAIVKSFTELQGGSFHIEIDGDLFKSVIHFHKKNRS